MRLRLALTSSIVAAALSLGCEGPTAPAVVADEVPDAIYTDFLGGKFDGAGHPVGAFVLEDEGCAPATGFVLDDGVDLDPALDAPGLACAGETDALGRGVFAINVRASRLTECPEGCADTAFEVRALDAGGSVLASRVVTGDELGAGHAFVNVPLELRVSSAAAVRVEVEWPGLVPARLEYVEVFRRDRQLVIEPVSGVPMADAIFRVEMIDRPDDASLTVRCGEQDVTAALDALLDAGDATIEETDFRHILTAPMAPLVEGCALPARLVVELRRPDRVYATSETYVLGEPIACPEDDGRPLVILTGFLPFPAGSGSDNSSHEAVVGFDPRVVPEARVMQVVLPVEFDTAAAMALDLERRCAPDVMVGFGQGRWQVDLETTAYNAKDTSEVPGGVPDNRGLVLDGDPIRVEGPAELASRLPIDAILADLSAAGVAVGTSDDPGRYICNNLFYTLAHDAPAASRVGFVHLPILRSVSDADRAMLSTVVESVVRRSLDAP